MKRNLLLLLILVAVVIPSFGLRAQAKTDSIGKTDTTQQEKKKKVKPPILEPYHRNTIKFNPTPMLLQQVEVRNITFSYERILKKNMSACIQLGYLVFPTIFSDTVAGLIHMSRGQKNGVNLAFDYRWYPFARNRRPVPDGVYVGGYLQYYGYQWGNNFNILNDTVSSGSLEGKLNIVNLGFELGYQFIFWKRFSLDLLLFGPSLNVWSGNINLKGDLTQEEIAQIDEELVDRLLNRFPSLGTLFDGQDLQFTGTKTSFGTGFRYSIQLGFHF